MRKTIHITSFVLILALILCMVGCGASKGPDSVVKDFCEGLKKLDLQKISELAGDDMTDTDSSEIKEFLDDNSEIMFLVDHLKENATKITYEIGDVIEDGDKATVAVRINYLDISDAFTVALGDFMTKALGLAFSGASEDAIQAVFYASLKDALDTVSPGNSSKDVIFSCIKDNGKWIISEIPEEIGSVVLCNLDNAFKEMENIFE